MIVVGRPSRRPDVERMRLFVRQLVIRHLLLKASLTTGEVRKATALKKTRVDDAFSKKW